MKSGVNSCKNSLPNSTERYSAMGHVEVWNYRHSTSQSQRMEQCGLFTLTDYLTYRNRPQILFLLLILDPQVIPSFSIFSAFITKREAMSVMGHLRPIRTKKRERGLNIGQCPSRFMRWNCTRSLHYRRKFFVCKQIDSFMQTIKNKKITRWFRNF